MDIVQKTDLRSCILRFVPQVVPSQQTKHCLLYFLNSQQVIEEHGTWLAANNARQISNYADFVRARWPKVYEDSEGEPGAGLISYGGGRERAWE